MVKKIRMIEEVVTEEVLDEQSWQKQMLEYQKSMDWKLWEMLKIMQGIVIDSGNDGADIRNIIIDEDRQDQDGHSESDDDK